MKLDGASKIRVFIVDDHHLVRRGLRLLLGGEPGITVCGEAQGSVQAMAALPASKPDVAIVDLSLKAEDGFELIEHLHRAYPEVRILVFTMHVNVLFAERALEAGASGYLVKTEPPDKITEAVRAVAQGLRYVSPPVDRVQLDAQAGLEWMLQDGTWTVRPRVVS